MSLLLITIKLSVVANLTVMEKEVTVEVTCRDSELYGQGSFLRKYGIELFKFGANVI